VEWTAKTAPWFPFRQATGAARALWSTTQQPAALRILLDPAAPALALPTVTRTIAGFYAALEARDWDAVAAHLDADVQYDVPQTKERIRGREAYMRFNLEYPGDWHLELLAVHEDDSGGAAEVAFRLGGDEMVNVAFFRLVDGRIARIHDYWPEPYDPPPGREHLVERY